MGLEVKSTPRRDSYFPHTHPGNPPAEESNLTMHVMHVTKSAEALGGSQPYAGSALTKERPNHSACRVHTVNLPSNPHS
jgi:hypothetical protein